MGGVSVCLPAFKPAMMKADTTADLDDRAASLTCLTSAPRKRLIPLVSGASARLLIFAPVTAKEIDTSANSNFAITKICRSGTRR